MTKLKPCPFCGGKDIEMWPMVYHDIAKTEFKVPVCNQCGGTICENYLTGPDTKKLIKAWNRRAK